MSSTFIKTQEDFECEHCGRAVRGNGYTNHCPACLWSKHVDLNPGDRAATCGGLMMPVGYQTRAGTYDLVQRCLVCEVEKHNKVATDDNLDILVNL